MTLKEAAVSLALVASLGTNATLIAVNQPKEQLLIQGAVVEQRLDAVLIPAHALIDADTIVADIPAEIQRPVTKFNPNDPIPVGTKISIDIKRNDSLWYSYEVTISDSLYPQDGQVLYFVNKWQLIPGNRYTQNIVVSPVAVPNGAPVEEVKVP